MIEYIDKLDIDIAVYCGTSNAMFVQYDNT